MNTQFNTTESDVHGLGAASAPPTIATTNDARSRVAGEFHKFLADIEDLIKATTLLTGEELVRAKAKLSARVSAAKESVEQMGGAVANRARNTAKVTNGYVHEHPWQAIGAGAALGLLIGAVIARRK